MNWILLNQNSEYQMYRLCINNKWLNWSDIFVLANSNDNFVSTLVQILQSNPFAEYYLEFKPTSFDDMKSTIFEFVIIKTSGFALEADMKKFGEKKLNTNSNFIQIFPNPSKNAVLICPCYNHNYPINSYINIGKFMSSANFQQKNIIIKSAFETYYYELNKLTNKKLWLSTHGKGVAWLHIRIDQSPKYISWNQYNKNLFINNDLKLLINKLDEL